MSISSTRKSKKQKNGPSGAPGPASASPWRAKRGTSEIGNIFVAVEGGTFWRKNKFLKKKSHNAEKLKGGTFGVSNIHSVAKHQKIEVGKNFRKKKLTVPKKTERGTLRDFPTSILTQNSKKIRKKSRSAKKIERGTLWSRPVWYVTRKNLFGSVRWAKWCNSVQ